MAFMMKIARLARQAGWKVGGGSISAHSGAQGRAAAAISSGLRAEVIGPIGRHGLPTFVDWARAGAVNPPEDQGASDCCYAFAAKSAIESINFIKGGGELVKLSAQQIIDGNTLRNYGSKGGSVLEAMSYVSNNGGLLLAEHYPYTGTDDELKRIKGLGLTVDAAHTIINANEIQMKTLVATSPICASIAAYDVFSECYGDYIGTGVLDGPDISFDEMFNGNFCHAVSIIGYGTDEATGKKFWKVKGSYGGDYIRKARGTGKRYGAFGINTMITFPFLRSGTGLIPVTVKSDDELDAQLRPRIDPN